MKAHDTPRGTKMMWNPRVKAICARAHGTGFIKTIAVSALSVAIMTSRAWPRHRPAASPAWGDVCLTSGGGEKPADVVAAADLPAGHGGRIDVQPDLTVGRALRVYLLGDAANIHHADGRRCPSSDQSLSGWDYFSNDLAFLSWTVQTTPESRGKTTTRANTTRVRFPPASFTLAG